MTFGNIPFVNLSFGKKNSYLNVSISFNLPFRKLLLNYPDLFHNTFRCTFDWKSRQQKSDLNFVVLNDILKLYKLRLKMIYFVHFQSSFKFVAPTFFSNACVFIEKLSNPFFQSTNNENQKNFLQKYFCPGSSTSFAVKGFVTRVKVLHYCKNGRKIHFRYLWHHY